MKQSNSVATDFSRHGFTLVEMLISVTLVLLMMTLFSAIFQMATSSLTTQRGVAANDQNARLFTTLIRADSAKRSFQYVQPFYPTESPSNGATPFGKRAGYLYISTNAAGGQDDMLQFTVDSNQNGENTDDTEFFGKAELLYDMQSDPRGSGPGAVRRTTLGYNPNQPETDDSQLVPNGVASSPAAEVSYFVRRGKLYRRVILLRNPLAIGGGDLSPQPVTAQGNKFFQNSPAGGAFAYVNTPSSITNSNFQTAVGSTPAWAVTGSNDFWRHFDFSAVPSFSGGVPVPDGVTFLGISSLDNSSGLVGNLGDPRYRFGFNFLTGLSREHDNPVDWKFMGRFVHAETSHPYFNWPLAAARSGVNEREDFGSVSTAFNTGPFLGDDGGGNPGNGNPTDLVGTHFHLDPGSDVLREFQSSSPRGGERRVEDLLLANVHSFKVEIWDSKLKRFVTPGHSATTKFGTTSTIVVGDYHFSRKATTTYGPGGASAPALNRVFDTWTPTVSVAADLNGNGISGDTIDRQAPFTPYRFYPPRLGDSPPGPCPNSMPDPQSAVDPDLGIQNNKGYWEPGTTYTQDDIVFAQVGFDGDTPNELFEWDDDVIPPQGFQIAYRCVMAGDSGPTQPVWPRVPGQRVIDTATGAPAQWISIDNRQPLKSMRVTVEFFEQNTEKLRQLSLTLPLTTDR